MGDLTLKCPLCCNRTFDSKTSLVEHLANILSNITCPICDNKWSSLAHLIEHLNLDGCQPEFHTIETIGGNNESSIDNSLSQTIDCDDEQITMKEEFEDHARSNSNQIVEEFTGNALNNGKMYMGLLSDEKLKACLQSQELKLVSQNGEMEQFVIMSQGGGTELSIVSAVVSKQNDDGTISLTTVNTQEMKTESATVIAPSETEVEDNPEELYSCNTCGVSFSSVIDHIQSCHNDQEVVVEEPYDDDNGMGGPIHYNTVTNEVTTEKQEPPRRVITESGDIVEAGSLIINITGTENEEVVVPTYLEDVPKVDKQTRLQGKRFVQIDEFCDSLVKNIKPADEKGGPYHKVVVKEVQALGGDKVKTYYCMSCNIYVSKLKDFKLHPCKILKYPCPHCPVAYENSKSLCAHMKVHKGRIVSGTVNTDSRGTYECEVCNTIFLTNKSLKLHKRMHDPVKARPIEPPIENSDGTEGSTGMYLCPVCDKMMPTDYRTVHQNSHKSTELNCAVCNKKFHSSEYLEMHMSVHTIDKLPVNKSDKSLPYSCLYCNRRFARPHEKVKHERIHTGEKPHSCEICGKSFRVRYCLTLHMRTHTGARPYTCQHCGKRFKAHSVYNHHLLTHSDLRAYKCPFCPKAFKTSVQLAGHKNSHTKPFSCQHCNRPFASLYAVRVHTETHLRHNNLKFSCTLCGASYARAFALKDHVKQLHDREMATDGAAVSKISSHTPARPFASLYAVRVHTETHLRHNNLKFSCTLCGASYARAFALKDHVKQLHDREMATDGAAVSKISSHTPARPFASLYAVRVHTETHLRHNNLKFSCTLCGASYARAFALKDHVKQLHDREMATDGAAVSKISSHTPPRPFASLYAVRVHTETHLRHNNLKFSCTLCGASYARAFALKDHVKQLHDREMATDGAAVSKISSHTPPRPFASLYAVRVHTETHLRHNNLKFWCTLCGASYARAFALKDHVKQLHDREMATDGAAVSKISSHTPPRPFASLYAVRVHTETHLRHNNLKFSCTLCGASYARAFALKDHVKQLHDREMATDGAAVSKISSHTPPRPFASLYAVRVHTETHLRHNNLKFSCTLCGASYARAFALKDHVKQLHDREMATDGAAVSKISSHTPPRPFASLYAVRVHTETHLRHNNLKFSCTLCGASYARAFALKDHVKQLHDREMATDGAAVSKISSHTPPRPFASLYAVRVHTETHLRHNNLKFWCTLCGASYARAFALKDHVKQLHDREMATDGAAVSKISSHTPARPFASLYAVRVHTETHLRHNNLKFSCTLCGASYARAFALKDHVKQLHDREMATDGAAVSKISSHTPPRPFASLYAVRVHTETHLRHNNLKFSCTLCGASYARAFALKDHVKQLHDREMATDEAAVSKISSHTPPRPFASIYAVRVHTETHLRHNNLKFSCTLCGASYARAFALKDHVKQLHDREMATDGAAVSKISSHTPPRPFASLYAVRVHTETHLRHNNLKFSCTLCGASYARAFALKVHVKQLHDREMATDGAAVSKISSHTPPRPFASLYAVRVHTETHLRHNNLKFSCTLCGASYARAFALKDHVKQLHDREMATDGAAVSKISSHTPPRPFASLYAVRVHTETHLRHNNLKFSCTLCGASYARAFALKDHVKQLHDREMATDGAADTIKEKVELDGEVLEESMHSSQ